MTTYERSLHIYQVLIAAAHNRQTLTYELLSQRIGVPQQGMARHLENIVQFCDARGLPPLTVLVVQKHIGTPSHGFHSATNVDASREQVYAHDWYGMKPPAATDFKSGAAPALNRARSAG
jgi:hypothetical protein